MPSVPPHDGWRWTRLTDLARLESGHTPSRRHPEWWGGDIPWLTLQDARDNHGGRIRETRVHTNHLGIDNSSARVLPAGTVCLSRTASVGYVVVMDRPMATSQDFVNWVCSEDLDPDFLKYLLVAEGDGLLRFASGAVHQTIYLPEAKAFYVHHPPLHDQKRLVGILGEAFEGLAAARENAEKNLRNARALYEGHVRSVFSPREGWVTQRLGDMCDVITKGTTPTSVGFAFVPHGVRFLKVESISEDGDFLEDKFAKITPECHDALRRSQLERGDILFSIAGALGRTALVTPDIPPANTNQALAIIRLRAPYCASRHFILKTLSTDAVFDQIEDFRGGVAQQNLSLAQLKRLVISLPPLAEQQRIVASLKSLSLKTRRLKRVYERKLAALDELKKSLLHQAFSGDL